MKWNDLKDISKAPETGCCLIYLRQKVLFEDYTDKKQVESAVNNQDILEIHLFDSDREYRAVASNEKRIIEHIADFENTKNNVYRDYAQIEDEFDMRGMQISVLNHIVYDDKTGMATIDDYRLVVEKEEQ